MYQFDDFSKLDIYGRVAKIVDEKVEGYNYYTYLDVRR